MMKTLFLAMAGLANAAKLLPAGEGFMHPWHQSLENDDHEINLHAAVSEDDVPDTNVYPDDDIELEKADDQALNWHHGNRKVKIVRPKHRVYENEDMW